MKYIVTFYAHFGAIRFKKLCEQMNIKAKIMPVPRVMPVPRDLSSSCGTCVLCEGELIDEQQIHQDEVEQIVELKENKYHLIYRAENS